MTNDPSDFDPKAGAEEETEDGSRSRVLRFARRLMDRKELAEDTRDLLVTLVSTSDKAKTEAVRLIAREVRNYLDALKIDEILTGYSLEISLHLKPLGDKGDAAGADPATDEEQPTES
jgi:hypothetical protein